jgi:acyl carrier protein
MEQTIHSIISRVFGIPASSLSAASSPATIPRWDSFGHMEITEALEREFSVRFTPGEISEMQNLGAIQRVLQRRLGGAAVAKQSQDQQRP